MGWGGVVLHVKGGKDGSHHPTAINNKNNREEGAVGGRAAAAAGRAGDAGRRPGDSGRVGGRLGGL